MRDVWLDEIEVMAARSKAGSAEGLYVAAKGAHNGESHNHNDVGNFIVYADGFPMIIDVGIGTYTAKTFSKRRYEIWAVQSAYHNVPTINGVMQGKGKEFAARNVKYESNESFAQLTFDISGAYPPEAGVDFWIRSIRLSRGREIQIVDSYRLNTATKGLMLSLMTHCNVTLNEPGRITLKNTMVKPGRTPVVVYVHYDVEKMTPTLEVIEDKDPKFKKMWTGQITRIVLRAKSVKLQDNWKLRITK